VSSAGKWDRWYGLLGDKPEPYGPSVTYQLGADWLAPCDLVEDWGCGKGWMRKLIPAGRYRGVDGSGTPFADIVADLTAYRSTVPGVFMRHVIEHDHDWDLILDNAVASAQERLCVILFTPLAETTRQIAFAEDPGVPDISFRLGDLTDRVDDAGFSWSAETLDTPTQYKTETILRCKR
jgi:hypothetical protein